MRTISVIPVVSVRKTSSQVDVWAFGFVIVVGGQFYSWNSGLVAGTVSYGISIVAMGLAYLCMIWSSAEVSSALPFAGGVYGLARCTLGFYFGFMAGCCEMFEYALYVTSCCVTTTNILTATWPEIQPFVPLMWFLLGLASASLAFVGGPVFWRTYVGFGFVIFSVFFVYGIGALSNASLKDYAGGVENAFVGGLSQLFTTLPQAAWFYSGIESLNTLANDVANPQKTIPKSQVYCMYTLLGTSWCIYLVSISLPPGAVNLPSQMAVTNGGFTAMFNVTATQATLVTLPAAVSAIPGFALTSSNILAALADSKLLPEALAHLHPVYKTPDRALVCVAVVAFAMCFPVLHLPNFGQTIYNVCMIFGFSAYIAQCLGYLYLHRHHATLDRQYTSPAGPAGAIYAIVVFATSLTSLLFAQGDGYVYVSVSGAILLVLTVYYHVYAKQRQAFSADERTQLFFAHVAKHVHAKSKAPVPSLPSVYKQRVSSTTAGNSIFQSVVPVASQPRVANNRIRSVHVKAAIAYTDRDSQDGGS
ncbi:Aste57867_3706 [Aphanomyces stellatus]|uniref:Aste57867_3706 protein n=2 Tax=Aphanomyces stellatus TaxID=120398 RepID=A0A485KB41_9STRA|nr:hypothetical protein As57867_003695 [Aphanomyces stellatus]VFT80860.1 Aste57867_3706 [Aphanomyces stellatus]